MKARNLLASIIVASAVTSLVSVFVMARGGAMSEQNQVDALTALIKLYLPVTSMVLAYIFGRRQVALKDGSPRLRATIAVATVGLWCALPFLAFLSRGRVEPTLRILSLFELWGEAVVLLVLGYYFGHEDAAA